MLDSIWTGVWYVLGALAPSAAPNLAFPALFGVVAIGAMVAVRQLVVPGGRVLVAALRGATLALALALLVPDWAIATGYRRTARQPPVAVYNFGDAVVRGAEVLLATYDRVAEPVRRFSRTNLFLVFVAVVVWFWWWNASFCPAGDARCVTPFAGWWSTFK